MQLAREERGSMVLEAALVVPFFLAFMLLLIGFIRIALVEMALQSAVAETAKVAAANMYPVEQLYKQGKSQWAASPASAWLDGIVSQAQQARQQVVDAESFADQYSAWIPEPLLRLVAWEKQRREGLETSGTELAEDAKAKVNEKLMEAAGPIVAQFADTRILEPKKIKVTRLQFPDLNERQAVYVKIEAEYAYTFAVPFFRKTVMVRKQAAERAWIGG